MPTSNNLPNRVLVWDDLIFDLQERLSAIDTPIYMVGGVVRDAFLRRPIADVDMATAGSGIAVARKIANALKGAFYPLDPDRDVGRALVDTPNGRIIFDVASFRGADLEADLRDRDFTINAMAVDLRGDLKTLIDPCEGEGDLLAHLIRRCNPLSLTHDPIRALRGVRQSIQFGFRIDPETLADMRQTAPLLAKISAERLRDEFFNLLNGAKVHSALRIADSLGMLTLIVPETAVLKTQPGASALPDGFALALNTIEHLARILNTVSPRRTDETAAQFTLGTLVMAFDRFRKPLQTHIEHVYADDRTHQALLILMLLLDSADVDTVEARGFALRLSNPERERLTALVRRREHFAALADYEAELDPLTVYRYWRDAGEAGVDIILLDLARTLARGGVSISQDGWLRRVDHAGTLLYGYFQRRTEWIDPPALINGRELMAALHLKPGRMVGELLEAIREAQVTGSVTSAADALELARRLLGTPGQAE